MKKFLTVLCMACNLTAFTLPVYATVTLPYHYENKMRHNKHGRIDKMYGYVDVTIENGQCTISVMFSNGRQLDGARFNADVKFFDTAGGHVQTSHFEAGIGAAGFHGAVERRPPKQTCRNITFSRVEVDLYLDNADNVDVNIPIFEHWERVK